MKRNSLKNIFLSLLALTLSACTSATQSEGVPAIKPTQSMAVPPDMRDLRYCEVMPVFRDGLTLTVQVYNTIGFNECPAELWTKLDAKALSQKYGAVATKLNGPRYVVFNQSTAGGETAAGSVADFGGIEMKLLAKIETKASQSGVGDTFYEPNAIQRTTNFLYRAGNRIYELKSPTGEVYRMQSYAQINDPTLTIADLETLDTRIELPPGWSYQTRVLAEDSELKADGLAYVITDNFYNANQKISP